ncbi:ABC transporter substrate-binding protein [Paenibacillus allorhizosphaerae]|uniref:ABC transporter substrate-binding protein YesO n=1 Tax=Paenibacillus allorhizosphaerae TaxID=2849866 RepID=A0ABM8VPG4_9BACL|nr:sugar ABC transporter substrate-binding protein [Paenibacillus allorhizosphaerae]CAG7652742.1 Putative ABC transporter substrate-binding protein YesO [Paenibacillus allorhizosphaerae]
MSKKTAIGLMLAFTLTACSSGNPADHESGASNTTALGSSKPVTLKIGLPGGYDITSKKLIDNFQAKNPNIKLEIEETPWAEFVTKIVTRIAGNNPPDLWLQENAVILSYGKRGVAENLEPYIKRDLKIEEYASALTSAKLDGKIYGIPHGINPGALAYNKQIFKEQNVPLPTDDWTYNDMIEAAKKLTKDTNGDGKPDIYGFQTGNNITLGWLPWMRAYGGSALDSTLTKSSFTDSKSIQGLTAWADTINKLKISPTREAANTGKFFENGKVAMTFFQYATQVSLNKNKPDLDWDTVKMPIGMDGKRFVPMVVNQWVMYSKSKPEVKEAGWTFLKYYLSDEGQALLSESGTSLPVKKTALQQLEKSTTKPLNKKAFTKGIEEAGGTLDENPSWNEWRAAAGPILNDIMDGKRTPEDGAKEIQQKVQQVLDENK